MNEYHLFFVKKKLLKSAASFFLKQE